MNFKTKAIQRYEQKEKVLENSPKFKEVCLKFPEDMTRNDWELYEELENLKSFLFDEAIKESYEELYNIFQNVTGYTLSLLGVTWEDFKTMVDEELGYGETVYSFYCPDLVQSFIDIGEIWFEQHIQTM